MSNEKTKTPELIAYTVADNGYFVRIGAAWANRKFGFNCRLVANPVNGEIVLLPPSQQVDKPE